MITLRFDSIHAITLNGVIDDAGGFFGIDKHGAGTLTLAGSNTYLGGTTVDEGTLIAANNNAFGNTAGDDTDGYVWATAGGTLEIGNGVTLNKYIYLDDVGVGGNGSLVVNGTAAIAGAGAVLDLYNSSLN